MIKFKNNNIIKKVCISFSHFFILSIILYFNFKFFSKKHLYFKLYNIINNNYIKKTRLK